MRVAKLEKFDTNVKIERRKIYEIPTIKRHIMIMTDKHKVKLIKHIERVVRSSMEYKDYIAYLRKEIDMTMCSFFSGVTNADVKKVSIEIHHEPFTLFDITQIVLEKWIANQMEINPVLIAEEIMSLHYKNKVGLIPLSITVHELVHDGKLFIPLQHLFGDYVEFLEEYEPYISEDLQSILQTKLKMSREIENLDMSILSKKYVYLEIDGMSFPQPLEEVER